MRTPAQMMGDNVSRAFLRAIVHLIGGYRDALKFRAGDKITFDDDVFIKSRTPSLQPFLEQILQLQSFRQFVEERLEMLNSGQGFNDEFELECVDFGQKTTKKVKKQEKIPRLVKFKKCQMSFDNSWETKMSKMSCCLAVKCLIS